MEMQNYFLDINHFREAICIVINIHFFTYYFTDHCALSTNTNTIEITTTIIMCCLLRCCLLYWQFSSSQFVCRKSALQPCRICVNYVFVSANQESVDWTAFLPFALSFFRGTESEWSLSLGDRQLKHSEGIPPLHCLWLARKFTNTSGRQGIREIEHAARSRALSAWRWRNDDDSIIWVFAFTRFQYKYRLGSACSGHSTSQCAGSVTASLLPPSLLTSRFPPSGEQTAFRLPRPGPVHAHDPSYAFRLCPRLSPIHCHF